MSGFSNFAVSFSIISVLAGCITTYYLAMDAGGPVAITLGWPVVGLFVLCVALAMAEVCSSYPTAGGLYFWAGRLARRNKRVWAWYVGWFNFLGEIAVTAAIDYGAAVTWMALLNLVWGVTVSPATIFLAYTVILFLHGLLNTFGVTLVKLLSDVSAWWHLAGVAVIVLALAFVPDRHQSLTWTFTEFRNTTGWASPVYAILIGLLMAQYTYTGYDASAHIAEETRNASVDAPKGIVRSVWVSILAGWVLLIAVTASIQNYEAARNSPTGLPPAQIFIDATGRTIGLFLLFICAVAQFFCGMASVTANSRMIYAFSRDGAIPGSKFWHKINKRTRTPTNSIWFAAVGAWLLVAPAYWLGSVTAYFAVTAIAVIGLYIAYVLPTFLRLKAGDAFKPGPWNLGKWSKPVGTIAVVWVVFICIMLMMPQLSPGGLGLKEIDALNYAPVAVGIVIGFAGLYWLLSARKWFKGPKVQGTAEELKAIERDLESV
jgi:amino acid permease (GABA permease)